jgi:hypothetical protein
MSMNRLPIMLKLVFVIAIASVLFSCTPNAVDLGKLDPNTYDQSWLTGKPCTAPCWYGLEPGVSTRQDSIKTVQQLPFISTNGIMSSNATWIDELSFPCKKPLNAYYGCIDLVFKNNVLDEIDINPNYQITFEQAIEKLGSPDGFFVVQIDPGGGRCVLQVMWKNKRLILLKQDSVQGIFSSRENLCDQIHHYGGKLPKDMFIDGDGVKIYSPSIIELLQSDFQSWEGFAK